MVNAGADYGFFFGGFIAIVAQLGEPLLIARSFSYLTSYS